MNYNRRTPLPVNLLLTALKKTNSPYQANHSYNKRDDLDANLREAPLDYTLLHAREKIKESLQPVAQATGPGAESWLDLRA